MVLEKTILKDFPILIKRKNVFPCCGPTVSLGGIVLNLSNLILNFVRKLSYKLERFRLSGYIKTQFPLWWSHSTPEGHDFNKLDKTLYQEAFK
jgi:hypothetical protein